MRIEHARIVAVPTTSYRFKRLVIEQNNEFNRHVAELSVFFWWMGLSAYVWTVWI